MQETSPPNAVITALAQGTPDVIVQYDTGLRCRWLNEAAEKLLSVSLGQARGATLAELMGDEAATKMAPQVREALAQGRATAYSTTAVVGGIPRHLDSRYIPIQDGEDLSVVAVCRDVTELVQMEERRQQALEERESIYRQMFTTNTAVKLLIDPHSGEIVDANPAALDYYGYSLDEIRRQRIQDINTLTPEEVRAEMQRAEREDKLYFRFRHRLAGGEVRDVEVYSGPVHVAGRELLHSIIHDVTDERRYRQRLEIYKHVFEVLPVGVYRNTPEPEGRFLEVNPALVRMFEADSSEALLGRRVTDLYEDPDSRAELSRRLESEGEVQQAELRLRTFKGNPLWASVSARRVFDGDGETYFAGVIEDISYRKRAAVQVQHERDILNRVLETSVSAITMFDAEGRLVFANSRAEDIFGEALAQLRGRRFDDPAWQVCDYQGRPIERSQLPFARIRDSGRAIHDLAYAIEVGESERRYLSINGAPLFGDGGELELVVFSIQDLTERREAEAARDRLITLIEASPDLIGIARSDGTPVYRNPALREAAARGGGEGPRISQVHPPEGTRRVFEEALPSAMREGVWRGENSVWGADGEPTPVSQLVVAHRDDSGEVRYLSTVMRDISELKRVEAQLADSRTQLQDIADSFPGAVYQFAVDADGHFSFPFISEGIRYLYGLEPSVDIADFSVLFEPVVGEDLRHIEEATERAIKGRQEWRAEFRIETPLGTRWIFGRALPREEADGGLLFNGVLIDITERKRLEKELERQAIYDRLTGIYNRQKFERLLEREVSCADRYSHPFTLVMFDIDRFKRVNDTFGHNAGDQALRIVALTARQMLRQGDLLGRWGGEEFMLILPHTDVDGAVRLAERLRREVAETDIPEVGGVTISLGVTDYRPDEEPKTLLKRVDDALYDAKAAGRDCIATS